MKDSAYGRRKEQTGGEGVLPVVALKRNKSKESSSPFILVGLQAGVLINQLQIPYLYSDSRNVEKYRAEKT